MAGFLYFIFAFLMGCIPTAYWVGKAVKNRDIRQHGSGNVGATNAFRVFGRGAGLLVLLIDLLKGAVPVYAVLGKQPPIYLLMVGSTAVLGHVFNPFLGFKGGKGVATASGVLLAVYPGLFGVTAIVWGLSFFVSRIVSLSSLLAVTALCLASFIWVADGTVRSFFFAIAGLIFWTHRSNIGRLLRGKEEKLISSSNR
jgi:glycerol-3-phosphate acyltransferase PlsY